MTTIAADYQTEKTLGAFLRDEWSLPASFFSTFQYQKPVAKIWKTPKIMNGTQNEKFDTLLSNSLAFIDLYKTWNKSPFFR